MPVEVTTQCHVTWYHMMSLLGSPGGRAVRTPHSFSCGGSPWGTKRPALPFPLGSHWSKCKTVTSGFFMEEECLFQQLCAHRSFFCRGSPSRGGSTGEEKGSRSHQCLLWGRDCHPTSSVVSRAGALQAPPSLLLCS